ncbi:ribosomal large subunit pseudouridine synthase A [Sulfurivirga caldicuralii]|uniref:Ribosomal large subunit pseudouridine synthase A n=1 Tax=Sulfurivirga caldicuralii TaxID=364032 RepID=A0A1N6DYD3_9GAMM|nr:RluA family pseudouridine synthase [Sulfurivirga caldicuralii]SIN75790.1 ribosomal large subunit pseudouridine synthase A [Sulfurivirga caldicuralii]
MVHIYYQDAHIVVAEKPAGLLSVPGRAPENHDSLTSRLQAQFDAIYVVHRLDMDTSGLMVFARTKAAQSHLSRQFQQRVVGKTYLAVCQDHIEEPAGVIDQPLRCDWPNRPRQIIDSVQGRAALTRWERLQLREDGHTLVRLEPHTGRAHQLRVHMQWLGHPILGDPFYHPTPDAAPRLMLHAWQLGFLHPASGHWMVFSSPPDEFFGMESA